MWQCGSKITTYHLLHITKISSHVKCVQRWYEKMVSIYIFLKLFDFYSTKSHIYVQCCKIFPVILQMILLLKLRHTWKPWIKFWFFFFLFDKSFGSLFCLSFTIHVFPDSYNFLFFFILSHIFSCFLISNKKVICQFHQLLSDDENNNKIRQ